MSQNVTRQELAQIIGEKTLKGTDRTKLVNSLAAYFAQQNKAVDLDSLARDIMQYRLEHGVVEAVIVSAHELTPKVVKDVEQLLSDHFKQAKSIILSTRLDESLVGGIRIELPQETLDLTVKSKLNLFKRLVAERN